MQIENAENAEKSEKNGFYPAVFTRDETRLYVIGKKVERADGAFGKIILFGAVNLAPRSVRF